jgi:flagellar motor component MotA
MMKKIMKIKNMSGSAHLNQKTKKNRTLSTDECIAFLMDCADLRDQEGILTLERIASGALRDDTYFREGLRLAMDGYSPSTIKSLMDNMKKTLLTEIDRRCEVIREGIIALAEGETQSRLARRCRTLCFKPL